MLCSHTHTDVSNQQISSLSMMRRCYCQDPPPPPLPFITPSSAQQVNTLKPEPLAHLCVFGARVCVCVCFSAAAVLNAAAPRGAITEEVVWPSLAFIWRDLVHLHSCKTSSESVGEAAAQPETPQFYFSRRSSACVVRAPFLPCDGIWLQPRSVLRSKLQVVCLGSPLQTHH